MGGAVSSRTFDQHKPPSLENVHQWFGTVIESDDSRTLKTSTRSSPILASNGKLDLEDSGEMNAQVATNADFDRAHMKAVAQISREKRRPRSILVVNGEKATSQQKADVKNGADDSNQRRLGSSDAVCTLEQELFGEEEVPETHTKCSNSPSPVLPLTAAHLEHHQRQLIAEGTIMAPPAPASETPALTAAHLHQHQHLLSNVEPNQRMTPRGSIVAEERRIATTVPRRPPTLDNSCVLSGRNNERRRRH
jgi:hypothetical protein